MSNYHLNLMDLDYINDKILSYYPLTVTNIELIKFKDSQKQRAIFKVTTPNSCYCLKKVYYSKKDLEFVLYLMAYINGKGMYLPKIVSTKSGESYLNDHGNLFFLMTWIDGKRCDFDKEEDLKLISSNLGLLHHHGIGFDFLPKSKDRYNYSNWQVDFNKKALKLLKIRDEIYSDFRFNAANNGFISLYNSQQDIIGQSLHLLMHVDFKKLMMKALVDHSFCHSDYVNKNLYISEDKVYMIDFDRAKLDIPIHDLGSLLRRILRRSNTKWNFSTAKLIVDSYNEIKPLSHDELAAILAYIIFPQKFYKETKRFLNDKGNASYYGERFRKIEKQYENKEQFINEFKDYYIKKA